VNQKAQQKAGIIRKILSPFRSLKSIFVLFVILSGLYALLRYTNIFKFNYKSKYTSSYYDYNSFGGTTSASSNNSLYGSGNSSYSIGSTNSDNVHKYFTNGPGLINRKYVNYNHIPVSSSTSFASANNSNNRMQQRSNPSVPQNTSTYSMPSAQPITISNFEVNRNANGNASGTNNNTNMNNNKYYPSQTFGLPRVNFYNNGNSNNNKCQPPTYQTPLPNPQGTPLQSLNNNMTFNGQSNNGNHASVINVQNNYGPTASSYSMNYSMSNLNPNPKNLNTIGSQDPQKKKDSNLCNNSSINISDAYFPNLHN